MPAMKLSTDSPTIDSAALDAILGGRHGDPFGVLGMHQAGEELVVRVFRPGARAMGVREVEIGAGDGDEECDDFHAGEISTG